jgi:hypothetical protein
MAFINSNDMFNATRGLDFHGGSFVSAHHDGESVASDDSYVSDEEYEYEDEGDYDHDSDDDDYYNSLGDDDDDEFDENGDRIPGPGRYVPWSVRNFRDSLLRPSGRLLPRPIQLTLPSEEETGDSMYELRSRIREEFDAANTAHQAALQVYTAVQADLAVAKDSYDSLSAQLGVADDEVLVYENETPDAKATRTRRQLDAFRRIHADLTRVSAQWEAAKSEIGDFLPQPKKTAPQSEWDAWKTAMAAREPIKKKATALGTQVQTLTQQLHQAESNLAAAESRPLLDATARRDSLIPKVKAAHAHFAELSSRSSMPEVYEIKMSVMKAELDQIQDQIDRFERRGTVRLGKDFVEEYDIDGNLVKKTSTKLIAELHTLDNDPPMKVVDGWEEEDREEYNVRHAAIMAKYPEEVIETPKEMTKHKQTKAISMADHIKFIGRHH